SSELTGSPKWEQFLIGWFFMKFILLIPILFLFCFLPAQIVDLSEQKTQEERMEMDSINADDLAAFDTIQLENVELLHLNLKTDLEKKYYLWLRKRVRDVWPYVKIAVEEYNSLQDTTQYF